MKNESDKVTASGKEKKKSESQATLLIELAKEIGLFQDGDGEGYARFLVGEDENRHFEVARIRGRQFKRWLRNEFFRETRRAPSAQAIQDAIGVIEAHALYDGRQHDIFVRVAGCEDRIYLDLCNRRWQAVEIDCNGWRVVSNVPVMFRRAKAMLSLPTPDQNGDIGLLRRFVNVSNDDWPLLLAWLVGAMHSSGPYPVLAVYGEHGSAKSTLCRYIRKIVDPNTALLRADYREPRDLMICANNGWIVALDNLSSLRPWLSDCLCRLATGGGFSTRTLYENDEETIFDAKRPVILNCIDEVVTRSDLLDRCVTLNLPRIDTDRRISEKQLDHEFKAALPRILGGLLTAVSVALRSEGKVELPTLPRMADFAIWATAAEPALGLRTGEFMEAYTSNRAAGNEIALEASSVGKEVIDFVGDVGQWAGISTELLHELEARADEKMKRLKSWPEGARALGAAIKRLAPNLREAGIGVEFSRTGRSRVITLTRMQEEFSVTSVTNDIDSAKRVPRSDGEVTQDECSDASNDFRVTSEIGVTLEDNGKCDGDDANDVKIPAHSLNSNWGAL